MAKRTSDADHGKTQRADTGIEDVVSAIKDLTNEVALMRQAYESNVSRARSATAMNNLAKYGSGVKPNINSIYPKRLP
jgi:hypothetical protein